MASELKSEISFLSRRKQKDLDYIVKTLMTGFASVTGQATLDWKKRGCILKIILFGSHAKNTYVDDRKSGYYSDFDLLVVVNDKRFTDLVDYWETVEDQFVRDSITERIKNEAQFIVHSLEEVNNELCQGNSFFRDIREHGIYLYNAKGSPPLKTFMPLEAATRYRMSKKYFDRWLPEAISFYRTYQFSLSEESLNNSAFQLHQAVEKLYSTFLLTLTGYLPQLHNIEKLRSLCEDIDHRLVQAWPRNTRKIRKPFNILKRAYVDARYSEHFSISAEDLVWLGQRVVILKELIETGCREYLEGIRE